MFAVIDFLISGFEPIRGCFPVNETLHNSAVTPVPNCSSIKLSTAGSNGAAVNYCSCNTDLCNVDLYNFSEFNVQLEETSDSRVKRHKVVVPENFVFPFQQRLESDPTSASVNIRGGGVKCYSCGSLFSRDTPHCPEFDPSNVTQQDTCLPGEVCLLYQWNKSKHQMGRLPSCIVYLLLNIFLHTIHTYFLLQGHIVNVSPLILYWDILKILLFHSHIVDLPRHKGIPVPLSEPVSALQTIVMWKMMTVRRKLL